MKKIILFLLILNVCFGYTKKELLNFSGPVEVKNFFANKNYLLISYNLGIARKIRLYDLQTSSLLYDKALARSKDFEEYTAQALLKDGSFALVYQRKLYLFDKTGTKMELDNPPCNYLEYDESTDQLFFGNISDEIDENSLIYYYKLPDITTYNINETNKDNIIFDDEKNILYLNGEATDIQVNDGNYLTLIKNTKNLFLFDTSYNLASSQGEIKMLTISTQNKVLKADILAKNFYYYGDVSAGQQDKFSIAVIGKYYEKDQKYDAFFFYDIANKIKILEKKFQIKYAELYKNSQFLILSMDQDNSHKLEIYNNKHKIIYENNILDEFSVYRWVPEKNTIYLMKNNQIFQVVYL